MRDRQSFAQQERSEQEAFLCERERQKALHQMFGKKVRVYFVRIWLYAILYAHAVVVVSSLRLVLFIFHLSLTPPQPVTTMNQRSNTLVPCFVFCQQYRTPVEKCRDRELERLLDATIEVCG